MSLLRRFVTLALLALSPLTMAAPFKLTDLNCRFEASTDAGGQVLLRFTLRNTGARDLHLLRWGSPFEGGWFGPFVRVRAGEADLPFQGAMRKRGEPAADDYLRLRAGQVLGADLPLNDAFALTPGPLRLKAGWRWHDVMTDGTPPRPRSRHQGWDQDCGSLTLSR